MLNHFNYRRLSDGRVLITNDLGRYLFLTGAEFQAFVLGRVDSGPLYERLHENAFLLEPMDLFSPALADGLREMKSYVFSATALHIFVVTSACNLRCVYCQAKDRDAAAWGFMTAETARRAVDLALQSPAPALTFEFQGGEPLLNFPVIREILSYSQARRGEKVITYTLVSNLSLLTEEILDCLIAYHVQICTSLDGPAALHDQNRPLEGGSFSALLGGLDLLRSRSYPFHAIQTTTRASLAYPREIVQTYHAFHLPGIFLRPLTPLGLARPAWDRIGYTPEAWLAFYRTALDEIIALNRAGAFFPELHATYFVAKILRGRAYNYMELRSPCGGGLGQLAYYYDGSIYTCDEARMVAEGGDPAFRLGDMFTSTYQDLFSAGACKAVCAASVLESLPGCCDCVYQPYCGVCPVIQYAQAGDCFPRQAGGYRCAIYGGILDHLFSLLDRDPGLADLLTTWIEEGGDTHEQTEWSAEA